MQTTSGQWDSKRAHEIITEHAGMPGALIPMLHALQHAFGYIDKSAVTPIAAALNLSNADVHGVITFYHDFRDAPGGKHQLQVCGAEACQACGCRELMTHATEKLGVQPGETTPDGMFTLNTVYCLGNCALSPAISIDGRMYGKVDANRFDQLIDTCKASLMTTTRIYVPRDAAAVSVGADEVAARIEHEAGARGLDVTVVRNGSRGMLYLEPLVEVVVNDARLAFGPVTVDDVPGLFDAGFLQGGAHPKALGKTEEIPYFAKQDRVTFARCGVIDPLDPEDYAAHGGTTGLRKALQMDAEAICQQVLDSGLRGRGGAGFPTGIKWQTVRNAEADQKYICCNADEGDSGTFADRMLMEGDPFTLIEGMTIAGLAVGATQGYVYIRSEYPDAMATMRKAIELGYALGWLGSSILDSGKDFHLDVRVGAGAYICGEETSMLESLEGKRGQVRAKPPIPALAGLFGKPTIVNNVLSLAAVPDIIADGAAAYQAYGVGRSRGTQAFQLAGNIARGGLVEKAFGISLNELIHGFGGGTYNGRPVRTVQIGGPLGAYVPADKFDLAADYETLAGNGAMLGHGGIVVFDDTVDMAQQARFALEFCAAESCGKCTPCRIGSVRGVETIDRILAGDKPDENLELLLDLCEVMTDGSLCAMGGLTPMPVRSAVQHFPEDFQRDNPPGASTSSSARVTN